MKEELLSFGQTVCYFYECVFFSGCLFSNGRNLSFADGLNWRYSFNTVNLDGEILPYFSLLASSGITQQKAGGISMVTQEESKCSVIKLMN